MISEEITIMNPTGLHARPAAKFVAEAKKYSSVKLVFNGKTVNGKSIVELLTAGIGYGDTVTLICDGFDEAEALRGITQAVLSGLGETIDQ